MLALGCEVVAVAVGSYSRLLRAAGRALRRERMRPSRDIFFTNVIRAHLNNLWNSQKHVGVLDTIDVEEPAWGSAMGLFKGGVGGGVFKRLPCHFFWHWETVFFF